MIWRGHIDRRHRNDIAARHLEPKGCRQIGRARELFCTVNIVHVVVCIRIPTGKPETRPLSATDNLVEGQCRVAAFARLFPSRIRPDGNPMISRLERGVETFELNLPTRLLCSVCGLRISGCVPRDRGVSSIKLKDHRDIVACWFGRFNFDEAGFVRIIDSGKIYIGVFTRNDVLDQGQAATIGRYPTRNCFPTGPVGAI